MAIPSGSESEIVYRTAINAQAATDTSFRFDRTMATTGTSTYVVPTNFLITVLNVSFCNLDTTAREITMKWNDGSLTINLLRNQPLPGEATFVWDNRIILAGADKLIVGADAGNIDCLCSYVVQDHT